MTRFDKLSGLGGGPDTTRLSTTEAAEDRRAGIAAEARGNAAAIVLERHGIDPRTATLADLPDTVKTELREVAQALGVDGAGPRQPGHCACGSVLTVAAAASTASAYLRGRCLTCTRAARKGGST